MLTKYSNIDLPPLHPKQLMVLNSPASEILYGGSTRAGKSFLSRWALIYWCTRIPGLQCDIFRLHFDDVIGNHMEGESGFPVLLKNWVNDKLVTITQTEVRFNFNGSLISLEHCNDAKALMKHQGIPKHVRVIEESTQIKERYLRYLRGWVSMSEEMKSRVPKDLWVEHNGELINPFPRLLYPTNPVGESAAYFRRGFVKARPKFSIDYAPIKDGGFLRQYVEALVEDNPSEDAIKTRQRIAGLGDDAQSDALLNANWDAPIGDFIRDYDENKHVVPDFVPPSWWFRYRSFDWGLSEPFSCGWFCVSDGEEFEYNGKKFWFPAGARVLYKEWYGCTPDDGAKGLGLSNILIAKGIRERSEGENIDITLADSKPFQGNGGITIAREMEDNGVPLILADTKREAGWSVVKQCLKGVDGFPMFYICEGCEYTREYLPSLQRHATKMEDAVESGEATHCLHGDTLIKTDTGIHKIKDLTFHRNKIYDSEDNLRDASSSFLTQKNAEVIKLRFSDGFELICTPDHKILTEKGWIEARFMLDMNRYEVQQCKTLKSSAILSKNLTAEHIKSMEQKDTCLVAETDCIELFGNTTMVKFQKGYIYITKMATDLITILRIWKSCLKANICHCICNPLNVRKWLDKLLINLDRLHLNGMAQKLVKSGIVNTLKILKTSYSKSLLEIVKYVQKNLLLITRVDSVIQTAKQGTSVKCIEIERLPYRCDVYCLHVPDVRHFQLYGGLVVHNCSDMVRYGLNTRPSVATKPKPIKEVIEPNTMTFNDALEMSNRRKNSSNDY